MAQVSNCIDLDVPFIYFDDSKVVRGGVIISVVFKKEVIGKKNGRSKYTYVINRI